MKLLRISVHAKPNKYTSSLLLYFLSWLMEYSSISSFRTEIWYRSKITVFLISWHLGKPYLLNISLIYTVSWSPTLLSSTRLSPLSWIIAIDLYYFIWLGFLQCSHSFTMILQKQYLQKLSFNNATGLLNGTYYFTCMWNGFFLL